MTARIALVVGLGNPGAEYAGTRHNAGFWFLDALAARLGVSLKAERRYDAELGKHGQGVDTLWLLKPMGYMNRSGEAVARLATFYKIPASAILVAHDDLDLPPGAARLKRGGGDGGHNGLRDTKARLGTADYARLRLGIGHPGERDAVVGYVLGRPRAEERTAIEDAITAALDAFPQLLAGEWERAVQRLHSLRPEEVK